MEIRDSDKGGAEENKISGKERKMESNKFFKGDLVVGFFICRIKPSTNAMEDEKDTFSTFEFEIEKFRHISLSSTSCRSDGVDEKEPQRKIKRVESEGGVLGGRGQTKVVQIFAFNIIVRVLFIFLITHPSRFLKDKKTAKTANGFDG